MINYRGKWILFYLVGAYYTQPSELEDVSLKLVFLNNTTVSFLNSTNTWIANKDKLGFNIILPYFTYLANEDKDFICGAQKQCLDFLSNWRIKFGQQHFEDFLRKQTRWEKSLLCGTQVQSN